MGTSEYSIAAAGGKFNGRDRGAPHGPRVKIVGGECLRVELLRNHVGRALDLNGEKHNYGCE